VGHPPAHFVWDSDTVNGSSVGQPGKIASGYTCPIGTDDCARTSAVTDAGIAYDTRGNITSYTQKSPNSAGWIYYWDGVDALGNLSYLGIHNLLTLTAASWDGEGRITSLTGGTTAPFTNATYGPFGPTAITYGSGDTDSYSYNNVGHIYNYQFSVGTGGQNYNGSVYWSANGTVRHLLTTNSVTGVNTTVNGSQIQYAYDDLGRLSAAGDVVNNTMNQSFSYDAYGNNTKSGSPDSWQPPYNGGYDPATNRYKTGGSCSSGIAYDTDGNLLCDTFHTYTWNGEARLSAVDGNSITRDAFGRVVESQHWGAQVLHTPMGDMWYQGQSFAWGRVRLPGGGSLAYLSSGPWAFNHPDWQGNIRLSTYTSRTFLSSTEYAPFGEDYDHGTGTSCCNFGFNGGSSRNMFADMYDTPNRELHPVQGRWIQPDPAGLAAVDPSNPQSWNRYAYVGNNPISRIDPLGLDWYDNLPGWNAPTAVGVWGVSVDPSTFQFSFLTPGALTIYAQGSATMPTVSPDSGPDTSGLLDLMIGQSNCGALEGCGSDPVPPRRCQFGAMHLADCRSKLKQPNIHYLQAKVFLTGLGRNFVNEFKEGGCVRTFFDAVSDGGILPDAPPGYGLDDLTREGGKQLAATYAITRVLTVPLRSSIYRGILETTETAASGALTVDFAVRVVQGVAAERRAYINGACD
jgi:RHS repeat-associated protein